MGRILYSVMFETDEAGSYDVKVFFSTKNAKAFIDTLDHHTLMDVSEITTEDNPEDAVEDSTYVNE